MIKANELRIGNWVEVDYDYINGNFVYRKEGSYARYGCDLTPKLEKHRFGFDTITIDFISPISLTPEIIEKIIFQPFFKIERSQKDSGAFWVMVGWVVYIRHVHQLQNLYFALTGEELEINL